MNLALLKAINAENKQLAEDSKVNLGLQFLKDNWGLFVSDRQQLFQAIKYLPDPDARSVLDYLGLKTVYLEKVEYKQMLSACYNMCKSPLWQIFKSKQTKARNLSIFFYTGKQGILMTDYQPIKPVDNFMHKLESEDADVYWATVPDAVKAKVRVF